MTKLKLIGLLAVDVSGFGIVMSADSQPVELLDGENRVLAGAPRIRNPILIRDGGGFRGLIGYVGTEAIDRQSTSEWLSAFGASRAEDSLAGSLNTETFFKELLAFGKTLTQEEARALSEGLSEELLAIFDLLMRPAPELSEAEKVQVKKVAEELLTVLKRDKIVLDWRKQQGTRAAVRVSVEETLDRLPEAFTRQLYAQKCDAVYQHVFDSYWDDGHSVYDRVA